MNQAKLYSQSNGVTRQNVEQISKEFSSVLQWRLDGKDSLLDVGTGSGDVLIDFIYPLMPNDFKKIIGTDISPKMVEYCQQTYRHMDRVHFKTFDIGTQRLPDEFISEFDHVTSFYCLHWVRDRRQALKNIFRMLKPNGDCLVVFLAKSAFLDSYQNISLNPKYASYIPDAHLYSSPYQNSEDAEEDFSQLLEDAGFSDFSVEVRERVSFYENRQVLRNIVEAVNALTGRIPTAMQEDYINEFARYIAAQSFLEADIEPVAIKCKLLVAYARK